MKRRTANCKKPIHVWTVFRKPICVGLEDISERTTKTAVTAISEMEEPVRSLPHKLGHLYESCHTGKIRFPEDCTRVRSEACNTDRDVEPMFAACLSGRIRFPEDETRGTRQVARTSFIASLFGRRQR